MIKKLFNFPTKLKSIVYFLFLILKNLRLDSRIKSTILCFFFIFIFIYRIGLLTNLSFLSFLLFFLPYIFLFLLMTDSVLSAFVESNFFFFFVCRSRCRCYTKRVCSLYYRRRSCRAPLKNRTERKRKKRKANKTHRPIIPLHIRISLFNVIVSFFFLSLLLRVTGWWKLNQAVRQ
jgi:hypothetical protein